MAMTNAFVKRLIAPLSKKLRLMVSRGVVELVNDSLKCQGLQLSLLADEVQDDVERFQDYGITSTPFKEAEVLFLSVGGNRSHGVAVCVMDRRYRPKDLNEGDVCLYTDKGERVYLDRDNDIVHIGAKAAAEFLALGASTEARLLEIYNAISGASTTAHDGGAALKAAIIASLDAAGLPGTWPKTVSATKAKGT
jgi:phage baseplate assembly protein V